MKICPQCHRIYTDETLNFCLDDGEWLIEADEPATAILLEPRAVALQGTESPTRYQIHTTDKTAVFPADRAAVPKTSFVRKRSFWLVVIVTAILIIGSVFGYRYFRQTSSDQINSIAVMPFVNESGNPELEYLSDGMTETLISKLSKVPNLNVKARASVFRYKGKEADPRMVGNDLGVQTILNGRVAQTGDQLSMTIELIDTATETVLWSEQYTRKSSELLSLQSDVARDVSGRLRNKLSGSDEQNLARNYTSNPVAYELYLKGRYHWNRRTVEDDLTALDYFQKAVTADPNFALAYVGISDARLMLGIPDAMAGSVSPADTLPAARAAADRAIGLDPTLAEAYASRAHVKFKERDWEGAETDFKKSIEINPNYSYARLFYSVFLAFNGRAEEAIAQSNRSVELDPFSIPINANLAFVLVMARRPDEAITAGKRAVELDGAIPLGHQRLGQAYEEKGVLSDAISEFQTAVTQSNRVQLAVSSLAHAYAVSGQVSEAKKLLAELEGRAKKEYISSYMLATVYVGLGEKQRAFELLDQAYNEQSIDLLQAKVDPKLDPLRDDPRFKELLKKIAFP